MSEQPPEIGISEAEGLAMPPPSPFKRISYALGVSPKAFQRPFRPIDWIVPVVLVIAIALVGVFVLQDLHAAKAGEQMRAQIEGNQRLSAEQRAEALEKMDQGRGKGFILATLIGGSIGGIFIAILIASALLMVIINFGLGGSTRFSDLWLVVSLSWVPKAIESVLFTTLARTRSSLDVSFGPAALVSADGLAKRILGVFDIFDIWVIAIQIVGVRILAGLVAKKASIGVMALWILWWLAAIAIAVATRGLPGAS
jgi:hypothetical protein